MSIFCYLSSSSFLSRLWIFLINLIKFFLTPSAWIPITLSISASLLMLKNLSPSTLLVKNASLMILTDFRNVCYYSKKMSRSAVDHLNTAGGSFWNLVSKFFNRFYSSGFSSYTETTTVLSTSSLILVKNGDSSSRTLFLNLVWDSSEWRTLSLPDLILPRSPPLQM